MKTFFITLLTIFVLALQLVSCGDINPSSYLLELPDIPEGWAYILGEPRWRIEWIDPNGQKQIADILSNDRLEIELPVNWANPVTAWPYWSEFNLIPGFFKPAGALFPFDVTGNRLLLSWEAGHDAVFFWELLIAQHVSDFDTDDVNELNYSRLPVYFDWPRFRELFESGILSEEVCEDPWLVNWRFVAERTVANNFDRRRLIPEAVVSNSFPVPSGLWYGTSPFAKPLFFISRETPSFPVRPGINVWVSTEGILRIYDEVWLFTALD